VERGKEIKIGRKSGAAVSPSLSLWLCVSVAKLGVERSDYEIIRE
jgi:hypothetical protein